MLEKYTIADRTQEADCDECGYPLYVGDTAYYCDDNGAIYCSETCAENIGHLEIVEA